MLEKSNGKSKLVRFRKDVKMRIKEEFLNETALVPYGFVKETLYEGYDLCEYKCRGKYCSVFTQRITGELAVVLPTEVTDCANIPDVVYRLIKDGLVELDEPEKANPFDEVSRMRLRGLVEVILNNCTHDEVDVLCAMLRDVNRKCR